MDNIRFIVTNKSRVEDWLKVNRLQLPLPNYQSDSAYRGAQLIDENFPNATSEIGSATPSISIIPPTDEKINTSDEKNSKPLNDEAPIGAETVEKHSQDELRDNVVGGHVVHRLFQINPKTKKPS